MAPRFTVVELLDADAGDLRSASGLLRMAVSSTGQLGLGPLSQLGQLSQLSQLGNATGSAGSSAWAWAGSGDGDGAGIGLGLHRGLAIGASLRAPSCVVWTMVATACALLLAHEMAVRALARKFLDKYGN